MPWLPRAESSLPHQPSHQQDKITSVAIPMAFGVVGAAMLAMGLDDLRWGKNRKEGF